MTWEIVPYLWLVLVFGVGNQRPSSGGNHISNMGNLCPWSQWPLYLWVPRARIGVTGERAGLISAKQILLFGEHSSGTQILYSLLFQRGLSPYFSRTYCLQFSSHLPSKSKLLGICSRVSVEKYLCSSPLPGKLANQVYCLEFCPLRRFLNSDLIALPEWS